MNATPRSIARMTAFVLAGAASAGTSGLLVGAAARRVSGDRMAPWIIGRASGVCAYLLLVALVLTGMVLSHPARTHIRRPTVATRIRLHLALATFTLVFVVLHVVVLATDRWAGVGWPGALLPMRASYRPVPTTLGLVAMWAGLLAGTTAALAGRIPRRLWWPVHKVAAVALVLVWLHGVAGGGDTTALRGMYVGTAVIVVGVGWTRYGSRRHADLAADAQSAAQAAAQSSVSHPAVVP